MQFETVIVARIPRTNCPDCGVLNIHIPWASPHGRFTLLFQAFAIRLLQASSSIEKARKLLGLSWNAVQSIMNVAVERGLAQRDLDQIPYVGIDEKNFGKGHDYVSIMTDIDGGRVLEVVPGRTREAADSLWKTLSEKQKAQVQAVAMDMWAAFINSAESHVPEADIVHDRFHIAKHLGEAIDQVRRAEHKALKKEGDEWLTGSRYLWLSREENLSEEKGDGIPRPQAGGTQDVAGVGFGGSVSRVLRAADPAAGTSVFPRMVCLGVALPIDPHGEGRQENQAALRADRDLV